MLLAHALVLAEARSNIAALADLTQSFDASVGYERVLLGLDSIHGDETPALDTAGLPDDPDILYAAATSAIEELVEHGVDGLQVELLLDMLGCAKANDEP